MAIILVFPAGPSEKKKERGYSRSRDRLLRLVGELLFHPLEAFPVIDLLGFMDGLPEVDRPAMLGYLFEPGSGIYTSSRVSISFSKLSSIKVTRSPARRNPSQHCRLFSFRLAIVQSESSCLDSMTELLPAMSPKCLSM